MINQKFSRQTDLIKPEELESPIHIIGAGGIGSWTTLALAKMGCSNLTVQDFDTVGIENTASQIYAQEQEGEVKVEALSRTVKALTGEAIKPIALPWKEGQLIESTILIMALDNLDTRRLLWEEMKKNTDVQLVIDGRMSGDFLRIFFVPLNGAYEEYEKTLVARDSVDPEPCTGKAVVYNVFLVASIITDLVKQFQKGQRKEYKEFAFDFSELQIL